LERAKRFGIQLNETSKKDIRAQRFGLPANDQKAPSPASPKAAAAKGGIAPEVLKKRAERFGLPENKTAAATKPAAVVKGDKVPVSLDPAEEEKKRKRAERFNSDASKKQKNE
jgi:SAP domain-containing ribonucleoprotein